MECWCLGFESRCFFFVSRFFLRDFFFRLDLMMNNSKGPETIRRFEFFFAEFWRNRDFRFLERLEETLQIENGMIGTKDCGNRNGS
jgi:hypothetical protein